MSRSAVIPFTRSRVNLVVDGNSLSASQGASNGMSWPEQMLASFMPPGSDIALTRVGIAGQTWRQMSGTGPGGQGNGAWVATDVDNAFDANKRNILLAWETTNAVHVENRTPAQVAADAEEYVRGRLAAHPTWRIFVMSSIPRENVDQATADTRNATLAAADALIARQCRSWGAKGFITLRGVGSPWAFPDYALSRWGDNPQLWLESGGPSNVRVHLTDAGYRIVAQIVAMVLRNAPM